MTTTKTLAVLGAGKLGIVVSQLALAAGYEVFIAGSGEPSKIALSIQILTPGAIATTANDAIDHADIVILALPLGKYRTLPADKLAGKLVIDAMNYWWEVDGEQTEFSNPATSSSEIVQAYLSGAHVLKAISHMGYHHLHDEARSAGEVGRKAIAIAGDDQSDNETAAALINDLGFDPVIIGPLSRGKILEPGHPLFGANVDTQTLLAVVNASI
jgi:predicted dinucleotide-binding enzyme